MTDRPILTGEKIDLRQLRRIYDRQMENERRRKAEAELRQLHETELQ